MARIFCFGVLPALVILVFLSAPGCVPRSYHQGSDLSKLDEFHLEKNRTTEKELIEYFGPSENTFTKGDGDKVLTWTDMRSEGTVNGATAIPIVGHFMGNSVDQKVTRRSLNATVRDGIMVDYTVADGNTRMAF